MGFLSRVKALYTRPRVSGYGGLWDNINTPGTTSPATTMGTNVPLVRPKGFTPNPPVLPVPAPEPYLKGVSIVSPFRQHSQPDTLQPEVPVKEPRTTGWGAIYNDPKQPASTAQVTVQQPALPVPGQAPPMTRQRDNEWDAGSYRNLQKGTFTTTPSQIYFNQRTPIPEFTTPSVFSNGVIAGNNSYYPAMMQHGWEQPFVPEPGMHFPVVGVAPPTFLSKPIHVVTNVGSVEGHRSPIKNAKAPKRQRSGG
jgi:hypothetical protein